MSATIVTYLYMFCFSTGLAAGFTCYSCSYTRDNNKGVECITDPDALGPLRTVKCAKYCITSEQWDINRKSIKSFFRGCAPDIGSKCTLDIWQITCVTSCKGNYCNRDLFVDTKNPPVLNDCKKFYGCNDGVRVFRLHYTVLFLCALFVNMLCSMLSTD